MAVALVVGVLDGEGLAAAARLGLDAQVVVGMVCGSRIEAGVLGHRTLKG